MLTRAIWKSYDTPVNAGAIAHHGPDLKRGGLFSIGTTLVSKDGHGANRRLVAIGKKRTGNHKHAVRRPCLVNGRSHCRKQGASRVV